MNPAYDRALEKCYQVWQNQDDLPAMIGHWRGVHSLDSFDPLKHGCVVLVEYARYALSDAGSDTDLQKLVKVCNRILAVEVPLGRDWRPLYPFVVAITKTVLAATQFNQPDKSVANLIDAARFYDRFWDLKSAPVEPVSNESQAVDKASGWLDEMVKSAAAACQTISVSTWLVLHRLLSRVLGVPEMIPAWKNELKMLVVDGRFQGKVIDTRFERIPAPQSAIYPDPLSFGVLSLSESMRQSLSLAWRCCRPYAMTVPGFALRIQMQFPIAVPRLEGASAGGLFAAGAVATMRDQKLDSRNSATCRLHVANKSLLDNSATDLLPSDVTFESIAGLAVKIDAAWQREIGVTHFFVCPSDAKAWKLSHPRTTVPSVEGVTNLNELLDGLHGDCRFEEQLERHANWIHGQWDRIRANDPKEVERDVNQQHRFELYIDPDFRIEGPKLRASNSPDQGEFHELRSEEKRDEFAVPGQQEDAQLASILQFALGHNPWTGNAELPKWLTSGKDVVIYDNAGAGKTVCSYRIRRLLTDPDRRTQFFGNASNPPLVIRLDGRWRRTKNTQGELLELREMLVEQFVEECELDKPVEREVAKQTVDYALRQRRVVVILDGYDQFSLADREHVATTYKETVESRLCRWIVTSRVHAIEDWRDRDLLFHDAKWMRVRIDPFSEDKQSQYFEKASPGHAPIGASWVDSVDPHSMGELLGLPMVLWLLRTLIEAAEDDNQPRPRFTGLSQLYLIASRWLLRRALKVNEKAVEDRLVKEGITVHTGPMGQKIDDLEHVLTLMAFQMMLIEDYNGRRDGQEQVEQFERLCLRRYLWDERKNERELLTDEFLDAKPKELLRWKWAMAVLRTIELEHRTVTESFGRDFIAFRSRKMLECHAARYLTKYANDWDIFADGQIEQRPITASPTELLDLRKRAELVRLCAWNYTTHPEWRETWRLAIGMPHAVLDTPDPDKILVDAVIDHRVTCRSLSALFRLPKPFSGEERAIRPTQLIYEAWHLFEYDERLVRERFGTSNSVRSVGLKNLLNESELRENVLAEFRASSRRLVSEFDKRLDRVLVNSWTGKRVPIPADPRARERILSQWRKQSSREKSLTFLQCPPPASIEAYESLDASQRALQTDPHSNPAIKGHETEVFGPIKFQATTVTRAMYRRFDPHFEYAYRDALKRYASRFRLMQRNGDFPIIGANWYDAWVFCKWLGSEYRLPTEWEWEHACRAATRTQYHFGNGLNGNQANCDGTEPYQLDEAGNEVELEKGPYLKRTTPVGLAGYPCNDYGLFDMHGNVWEWCDNWHESGSNRVNRGGSWSLTAWNCRSASRLRNSPDLRSLNLGFRVSLVPSSK